jgi:hypothetical protein
MVAWLTGSSGKRELSNRAASRYECLALSSACSRRSSGVHRSGRSSARGLRDIHKAPVVPARAHTDPRRVNGDGTEQRLDFTGSIITPASELQTVPAHTGAGSELFHLGLEDQAGEFAQQTLALGQRQPDLLRRQPDNPSFKPAYFDRL